MTRFRFRTLAAVLTVLSFCTTLVGQELTKATTIKQLRRLPRGVTETTLGKHQIEPAHTLDIQVEETDPAREVDPPSDPPKIVRPKNPKFDLSQFEAELVQYLEQNAGAGYAVQINQNGTPIYFKAAKYAQTPTDLNKMWSGNTRMHVASVSKLLTSMALIRALNKKNISYEQKILNYLPAYWDKGQNTGKITFKDLLQHHSGLLVGKVETSYKTMKTAIQRGVAGSGPDAD